MPVSPEQLLARAQELLESSDELNFRESAKIAYYAAYHLLKPLESVIEDPLDYGGGEHSQLIGVLGNHDVNSVKSLAFMLRDCRTRRNQADYDIELGFDVNLAKTQIEMVVRIFAKYREILEAGIIVME